MFLVCDAGGGFSIGLVLVLFRTILSKTTLPTDSKQAYALIRQMMYLTFLIGIVGITAWYFSGKIVHQVTGHVLEKDSMKPIVVIAEGQ